VIRLKRREVAATQLPLLDVLEDWGRELQREILPPLSAGTGP